MAYEIGYVDNTGAEGLAHWQLLARIKALAEANGWTTLRYTTPTDGTNRELILQGPGLSGTEQIFIGFRTYHSVAADYYNVSVAGFTGYVAGNSFSTQPGYFESGIPAHNIRIDYWILVNAQRIALGLKVGTPVYEHGYTGKFLPYALPDQFPYPLAVGGALTGLDTKRYSDTAHNMPYIGNVANFKFRFVDGLWNQPNCWPWSSTALAGSTLSLRDTNGNYSLQPIVLHGTTGVYGILDGVFHISGFNNAVENTLVIGGVTYVVLQNAYRTGFNNYVALRLS